MAVVLLKLVFTVLSLLSNLISRVIVTGLAQVLVQIIQGLKGPGEGGKNMLEWFKDTIKSCLEYVLALIIGLIGNIASSLFDLVKGGIANSWSGMIEGIGGLMEQSKTSFEDMFGDTSEVVKAFVEMIGNILTDFLSNCNDAVDYVRENVFN